MIGVVEKLSKPIEFREHMLIFRFNEQRQGYDID